MSSELCMLLKRGLDEGGGPVQARKHGDPLRGKNRLQFLQRPLDGEGHFQRVRAELAGRGDAARPARP